MVRGPEKLVGGPIGFGYAAEGGQRAVRQVIAGFDALLTGEAAITLDNYLAGNDPDGMLDYSRTDPWSVTGSSIIRQHPDYPYVMCELETARGCAHGVTGGCSFCTEPFYGVPKIPGDPRDRVRSCSAPRLRRPALPGRAAAGHSHLRRRCRSSTLNPP